MPGLPKHLSHDSHFGGRELKVAVRWVTPSTRGFIVVLVLFIPDKALSSAYRGTLLIGKRKLLGPYIVNRYLADKNQPPRTTIGP